MVQDSSSEEDYVESILKTIPKDIKPVFGYRFVISGDFDGDGLKEMLVEHYYSQLKTKRLTSITTVLNLTNW